MPVVWRRLFLDSGSRWNPQFHGPYLVGSWSHQTRILHQTELWHHLQIQGRGISIKGNVPKSSESRQKSQTSLSLWVWRKNKVFDVATCSLQLPLFFRNEKCMMQFGRNGSSNSTFSPKYPQNYDSTKKKKKKKIVWIRTILTEKDTLPLFISTN